MGCLPNISDTRKKMISYVTEETKCAGSTREKIARGCSAEVMEWEAPGSSERVWVGEAEGRWEAQGEQRNGGRITEALFGEIWTIPVAKAR